MRHVQQVIAILPVCFGFVILSAFQGSAEHLYQWKDHNGISCFSNVSPPDGVRRFSAISLAPSAASDAKSPEVDKKVAAEVDGERVSDDIGPAAGRLALQERIRNRKASISAVEALLKTRPNDTGLRKHLYQKKQALYEDFIRLKLLTN